MQRIYDKDYMLSNVYKNMKKGSINECLNNDYLGKDSYIQTPRDGVKSRLLQIYSNIKLHLNPAYQAASALILNGKITPGNLERLIATEEGRETGTTYNKEVLNYAKMILTKDSENNGYHKDTYNKN